MLKGLYEEAMERMIDYYKTCLHAACNDLKCPKYYPASNSMSEVDGLGLLGAPLYTVMQHISAAVGKRNIGRIQHAMCNELDSKRAEGITTPSDESQYYQCRLYTGAASPCLELTLAGCLRQQVNILSGFFFTFDKRKKRIFGIYD